ncbi:glycosyltransferase [Maricaulaceae bacterium EIL42A08]|nr:glycosyltransferase [Maricaulaceae bacterium EIL42A08]
MESRFACLSGGELDPGELRINRAAFECGGVGEILEKRLQWGVIPEKRAPVGGSLFSIGYPGVAIDQHPAVIAADIVHLHWPTWMVTPVQIRRLLDAGKTVFWTLHDMWAFTGGCHYASGCVQFQTACMKCPQMSDRLGLASLNFEDKLAAYGGGPEGFHVVALCEWMKKLSTSSAILGEAPTTLIPNPIDTEVFAPTARDEVRAALGFQADDAILLFGNFDNSEARKGSDILLNAFQALEAHPSVKAFKGRIALVSFGRGEPFELPARFETMGVGEISDDRVLASIYSAADLFVFPSIEDNYPNSVVESGACGTPSVVFSTGGMSDMVAHDETGWQVTNVGDSDAFADGVGQALTRFHGDGHARHACREVVVERNDPEAIGKALVNAYRKALGKKPLSRWPAPVAIPEKPEPGEPAVPVLLADAVRSRLVTPVDEQVGGKFAKFPMTHFLRNEGAERLGEQTVTYGEAASIDYDRIRVLAVRSFHEHHSAHSGPYQYLRHLPRDRFVVTNVVVPLGSDLAVGDSQRQQLRDVGKLLGSAPLGTQSNAWLAEWELARLIKSERFDLVHFIDGELSGWLVSRLPEEFFDHGRPTLATMLHQPNKYLRDWLSSAGLERFDLVTTMCDDQTRFLRHALREIPVHTIRHGVDTKFFCSKGVPHHGGDTIRLLAVGQWLRDYDLAFAALDRLAEEGLKFEYRVVSKAIEQAGAPDYVTVLQGISDEELVEEYRQCDVMFMPLAAATANNALLEAMACGCPVVTSDNGGLPEYVSSDAGVLCPSDIEAFAEGLRPLLVDKALRERMGVAARANAERFAWERMAEQYAELYEHHAAPRPMRKRKRKAG